MAWWTTLVGVTEAGFRAQQMNALTDVKTAEKGLQFGSSKCKSMLIGKNVEHVLNSNLTVDNWKIAHDEVTEEIVETYEGQISIDKTDEQKYL